MIPGLPPYETLICVYYALACLVNNQTVHNSAFTPFYTNPGIPEKVVTSLYSALMSIVVLLFIHPHDTMYSLV